MKACVIDASVVAAALFQEAHAEAARALLVADCERHAPDLILAEVGNVIWKRHGRKEIDEAEALRHLELGLAIAAGEAEQARSVDKAEGFGLGFGEELGAERPQQPARDAGVLLHHVERVAALGHRALPENLAGGDQVEALPDHDLGRLADHGGVAVDAGVEAGAETVGRVLEQGGDVRREVHDVELDAKLFRGLDRGVGREEGAGEGHALHMDALLAQHADGELAVETAGDQAERLGSGTRGRRGWRGIGSRFCHLFSAFCLSVPKTSSQRAS